MIITSNFEKINKNNVVQNYELYKIKARNNKVEQNKVIFYYSKYLTLLFILDLFNFTTNENVFIPKFTHNAIPINLKDLEEIYKVIYESKYKYSTLDCNYRISGFLQFQIFILLYTFIKFNRKVKNIPSKYIEVDNQNIKNYNFPLFCINKGAGNYSYLHYFKSKMTLEFIFHNPSPYEIIDYSFLNLTFNIVYDYEKLIKNYRNIFHQLK